MESHINTVAQQCRIYATMHACAVCSKPTALACERCCTTFYCGDACAKTHWSTHRGECEWAPMAAMASVRAGGVTTGRRARYVAETSGIDLGRRGASMSRDAMYGLAVNQRRALIERAIDTTGGRAPTKARARATMMQLTDGLISHHLDTLEYAGASAASIAEAGTMARDAAQHFGAQMAAIASPSVETSASATYDALRAYIEAGYDVRDVSLHAVGGAELVERARADDEQQAVEAAADALVEAAVAQSALVAAREARAAATPTGKRARDADHTRAPPAKRLDAKERAAAIEMLGVAATGLVDAYVGTDSRKLLARFFVPRFVREATKRMLDVSLDALSALLGALMTGLVLVGVYRAVAWAAWTQTANLSTDTIDADLVTLGAELKAAEGDAAAVASVLEQLPDRPTLSDAVQASYMDGGGSPASAAAAVHTLLAAPLDAGTDTAALRATLDVELKTIYATIAANATGANEGVCPARWTDAEGVGTTLVALVQSYSRGQADERSALVGLIQETFARLQRGLGAALARVDGLADRVDTLKGSLEVVQEARAQAPIYTAIVDTVIGRYKAGWLVAVLNNVGLSHVANVERTINALLAARSLKQVYTLSASMFVAIWTNSWTASLLAYAVRGSVLLVGQILRALAAFGSWVAADADDDSWRVTFSSAVHAGTDFLMRGLHVMSTAADAFVATGQVIKYGGMLATLVAAVVVISPIMVVTAILVHSVVFQMWPYESFVAIMGAYTSVYNAAFAMASDLGVYLVRHPWLAAGLTGTLVLAWWLSGTTSPAKLLASGQDDAPLVGAYTHLMGWKATGLPCTIAPIGDMLTSAIA